MKSLDKIRDVLILVASPQGAGLPDLVRRLAMPKSTVYRLLRALHSCGFVVEEESHRYKLGPLIGDLAAGGANRERIIRVARPHMVALRDECDETVALHLLEGGSRVVVDQVVSTQELRRIVTNLGVPMPLGSTAPGKVFLAAMKPRDSDAYIKTHKGVKYTANTPAPDTLRAELADIRKRGWAASFAEMVEGVASVAMPVKIEGEPVSIALVVSGPLSRFTPQAVKTIAKQLKTATQRVSRDLQRKEASA